MRRCLAILLLVVSVFILGACASVPSRIPHTAAEQAAATVVGMPSDIRFWADAPPKGYAGIVDSLNDRLRRNGSPSLLALSGGADDGAYGAGFLNGWSKTGTRPEFTLVTGVSTGALIAPYAFLGAEHDDTLRQIFTGIDASDVFVFRGIAGFFGTGLTSNAPLAGMIRQHVTAELLQAIAREYRAGRHLLVATTNLDAQRTMVWNMGRIAEIGTPRALAVFRRVLLASTSIPGIFPPTLVEVEGGGQRFDELHVDGGAITQVFTVPTAVLVGLGKRVAARDAEIYMIINNTFKPDFEVVRASTIPIASRSFSTIIKSSVRQSVLETYDFALDNRAQFRLTFIGEDFDAPYPGPFDQTYMTKLFEYGVRRGRQPVFLDAPPIVD